ncbi:hypothetical protein DPMN_074903 [Dreissena polymorpha]|uniref:E2 domain-containing protein n=1 Tax=Dreissena polymorpha TaxID=45954 RepID=A0A9D3YG74_DREPO|nr:hypothetical protein DPMN_074903 [Dreissena polymorpha]
MLYSLFLSHKIFSGRTTCYILYLAVFTVAVPHAIFLLWQRFQRLYQAFEQEADSEKKQLISLHQQRVQAMFNKKKRLLMTQYKEELESKTPSVSRQSD